MKLNMLFMVTLIGKDFGAHCQIIAQKYGNLLMGFIKPSANQARSNSSKTPCFSEGGMYS